MSRSRTSQTRRPDPITPKVAVATGAGAILAAVAAAIIDAQWDAPESNTTMDWVRSLLPLLLAVAGAVGGALKAKQQTTPLSDPRDNFGRKLKPVGDPPPPLFDQDAAL